MLMEPTLLYHRRQTRFVFHTKTQEPLTAFSMPDPCEPPGEDPMTAMSISNDDALAVFPFPHNARESSV